MDWSWLYIFLLFVAAALFIWGAGMRRRSYMRSIRVGAWLCLIGAVLAATVLVFVFDGWLDAFFDSTRMDWGIFTGWAQSTFVRGLLFILLLVIVGSSAYIWRVKQYRKHRASHGSTPATTH